MRVSNQRGDTIIEVVLALAVFALVTVSMFAIMQRGSASAYDSLERTQVRLLLNQQAEWLNFLRDQYLDVTSAEGAILPDTPADIWNDIRAAAATSIPTEGSCTDTASNPFFITQTATGGYTLSTTLSAATGMPSPGQGLWIQKVNAPSGGGVKKTNYYDFYVMACWPSTTGSNQTLSSVVRLYAP